MRLQHTTSAIAPWVLSAALVILGTSCNGPDQPTSPTGPENRTAPNAAMNLRVAAGPTVTVTNEYIGPVATTAAIWIPDGVPLTFCWTAAPGSDGAAISAHRYGWDIIDPDDPNAWDMDLVPYDGSEVCAPARAFETGLHFFLVQVVDEAGHTSLARITIIITNGPSSFDVMPGTCRNKFNSRRGGRIRAAIPGRIGMDAGEIDVSSLYLWIDGNVVEPVDTRLRDVTGAMIPGASCACPAAGPDGYDDVVMSFDAAEISRALGPVANGEERRLTIHGSLVDGYKFSVTDCVTIAGNPPGDDEPALFFRDAVLATLERAYQSADYALMEALLDEDFTFYFGEGDVQSGDVSFQSWDRDHELAATAALFGVDSPSGQRALSKPARASSDVENGTWGRLKAGALDGTYSGTTFLVAELAYPEGDGDWIAMNPSDPRHAGETWYAKNVYCTVFAQWDGGSYISYPYRGLFTVRLDEGGRWRLVEWRDDIQESRFIGARRSAR